MNRISLCLESCYDRGSRGEAIYLDRDLWDETLIDLGRKLGVFGVRD